MRWLKFSIRSVLRNGRRSMVTVLIVAIGAVAILASQGFTNHTNSIMKLWTIDRVGNVIVSHKDYFDREEETMMELSLSNYRGVKEFLDNDDKVRFVLPAINFNGMISTDSKSGIFSGVAHDPEEFHRSNSRARFVAGRPLSKTLDQQADAEIILGKGLAEYLNVEVGGSVTLMSSTTFTGLNAIDFVVVGIVDTGNIQANRYLIYTRLLDAQQLVDTAAAHILAVHLHDHGDASALMETLQRQYPNIGVSSWSERAESYKKVRALFGSIFGVMSLIVMIMVFFSVSNTMSQVVIERTREIGTMSAMGAPKRLILTVFVSEALIIGVIGVVIGVVVSYLIGVWLGASGATIPPGPGFTNSLPLKFLISGSLVLNTLISLVLACMIACWMAARRGANQVIVEALSHV